MLRRRRPAPRAEVRCRRINPAAAAVIAVCVWLAAAAVAAQASPASGWPRYHHPDHDELPEETFVPKSAVTEADRADADQADDVEVGDLAPGAGRIIGSPDPGPEPQHSGDRGGWRQLALLGALAVAVAAIMARILLAARRHDRASPGQTLPSEAAAGVET